MPWDPDEQDRLEELEPLHYDVPPHLHGELWNWIRGVIEPERSYGINEMLKIFNVLRKTPPPTSNSSLGVRAGQYRQWFANYCITPDGMLNTIRAILKHLPYDHRAKTLEEILVRGKSGYAVRMDRRGLEFRVHPSAREQVELAISASPEGASKLLTKAWNAAYGMDPRPDDAWSDAFKATEAILRPIISPEDGDAKLGKMIGDYDAKPEKWGSCITESRPTFNPDRHTELDGRETVMQLARAICYGQKDRHAAGESANSLEEARAAVTMAVAIAMLCDSGALRRVA